MVIPWDFSFTFFIVNGKTRVASRDSSTMTAISPESKRIVMKRIRFCFSFHRSLVVFDDGQWKPPSVSVSRIVTFVMQRNLNRMADAWVAWPSGLRRWFKAPVISMAWVRIPPLPSPVLTRIFPENLKAVLVLFYPVMRSPKVHIFGSCPTAIQVPLASVSSSRHLL